METRPRIERLVWDDWNREHLTKHSVAVEEAEEVIAQDPVFALSYKNRVMFTGQTAAGRTLTVVAGAVPDEPNAFYVFSARPASRKERASFAQSRGEASI